MSALCDVFPDDPSCAAPEPEPQPEPEDPIDDTQDDPVDDDAGEDAGEGEEDAEPEEKMSGDERRFWDVLPAVAEWSNVKDLSTLAMLSPMTAHLTYGGVATGFALSGFFEGLRYRKDVTISGVKFEYYTSGKVNNGTNWWKLSDQIRNFSYLGIGGVLALTSLMAAFGIATGINALAWMYLGGAGVLIELVIGVIRYLGFESYYSESKSTDATIAKAGVTAMGIIKGDALYDGAMSTAALVMLYGQMEAWYYDFWNSLSEQDQAEMVAGWEETIATRAEEIDKKRAELGLEEGEEKEDAEEDEGEDDDEDADGEEGDAEGEDEEDADKDEE